MSRQALLALGLVIAACDGAEHETPRAPVEQTTSMDHESSPEEPAPLPGTIEACTTALAQRTPAELEATLDDLGYDTAFRDACTAMRAEADRDLALCGELSVTVLRDRCRERVAIAAGNAAACPDARAGDGHEPLCLALARRDARLCAAAGTLDRAVCDAVLSDGDAHPGRSCGRLPVDLRAACIARSERLAPLATGERVDAETIEPALTLTIDGAEPIALELANRGARIVYDACIPTLVLGEPRSRAIILDPEASLLMRVPLAGEAPIESEIGPLGASLEVSTSALRGESATTGHVSITALTRELGATIQGTFRGELRGPTVPVQFEGAFVSFVRDVDARPSDCP